MPQPTESDKRRFLSKVTGDWATGCWVWQAAARKGYGRFKFSGSSWLAHRWAWAYIAQLELPTEELDHICRNTRCVRPGHLQPASSEVNKELHHLRRIWPRHPRQALVPPVAHRSIAELITAVEFHLPNVFQLPLAFQTPSPVGLDDPRVKRLKALLNSRRVRRRGGQEDVS